MMLADTEAEVLWFVSGSCPDLAAAITSIH